MESSAERFDKFTMESRNVLQKACEEAVRLNHNYISTCHLLLGFLSVKENQLGAPKFIFESYGITLEKTRQAVEELIGKEELFVDQPAMHGLTTRAREAIKFAIEDYRNRHDPEINSLHLARGLMRIKEGTTAKVLEYMGINQDEMLKVLEEAHFTDQSPK